MKTCTKCKFPKELDDFYKSKKTADGRTSWCRLCMKASNQRWHDANVERHRQMNKACYSVHKEQKHQRRMERLHTDPKVRLIHNMRARLHDALGHDRASTRELVGCTAGELKRHLEAQFQAGMSWDNYGAWHVDHTTPLVKMNVADPESIRAFCHYTNLQPLWAEENLSKGAR